MAAITFPATPTMGQKHTVGPRAWVWDGAKWELAPAAAPAVLPGIGGWADITAVTGNPAKNTYKDANGVDWTVYEWATTTGADNNKNGSVTTTKGLVDILVCSQGGNSQSIPGYGSGGEVRDDVALFPAGTHTIISDRKNSGPGVIARLGHITARPGNGFGQLGAGALADAQDISIRACLPVLSSIRDGGTPQPFGGGAYRKGQGPQAPDGTVDGPDHLALNGLNTGTIYHRADHYGGGGFSLYGGIVIVRVPAEHAKA